jgi:DNA-binding XRE family transcriptional regulator
VDDWTKFRDKLLADDPDTAAEYERLGPQYAAIADIIRLRLEQGLTQEQLARRVGKQQPAIARLESGRVQPSLQLLHEIAKALDADLVVHVRPRSA